MAAPTDQPTRRRRRTKPSEPLGGYRTTILWTRDSPTVQVSAWVPPGLDPNDVQAECQRQADTYGTELGNALFQSFGGQLLPTGPALYDYWRDRLRKPERLTLTILVNIWPATLTAKQIAARTGYPDSARFREGLTRLRRWGLIHGRNPIRADADLVHHARSTTAEQAGDSAECFT